MFTAKPRQAIGIASAKWIVTGAKIRLTDSYAMSNAIIARIMALLKPARSPNLPVPKVKFGSSARLRA